LPEEIASGVAGERQEDAGAAGSRELQGRSEVQGRGRKSYRGREGKNGGKKRREGKKKGGTVGGSAGQQSLFKNETSNVWHSATLEKFRKIS
jgi:hypothetical protein